MVDFVDVDVALALVDVALALVGAALALVGAAVAHNMHWKDRNSSVADPDAADQRGYLQ